VSTSPNRITLIVAGIVFLAGAVSFVILAEAVLAGKTQAFDERIIQGLRDPADPTMPRGSPDWRTAIRDITALGGPAVLVIVSVSTTLFLLLRHRRRTALLMVVLVISGALLSSALKRTFGRDRPDVRSPLVHETSPSFPSGHAQLSAVIYLTLGVMLARSEPRRRLRVFWFGLALLLTLLIGCSRFYLGVHYPTDVMAGWAVGMAWAAVGVVIAQFFNDDHAHALAST
jgi:undecaprenyl-diphosphatase